MATEEIFSCVIVCGCGLCCSSESLCVKCEINTLLANGLPETLVPEIHGLKQKSGNHGNGFEFSELYKKLKQLQKDNSNG